MKRRTALAFLGIGALSGCGGGGSPAAAGSSALPVGVQTPGATSAEAAVSTPSAPAAAVASTAGGRSIACWGDSITNLYAPHLQAVFPGRQVYNGGVVGETSAQINARELADTAHKDWVSVFWYGHNDWFKDQVGANLAASIAALAPGTPYVVMSILNWSTDLPGTTQYNAVLQANAALAQKYPNNFLDIRSLLVSWYDGSIAQDVIDHSNDETPSSLRFDTIHLNDKGCNLVAAKVGEFITAKGW